MRQRPQMDGLRTVLFLTVFGFHHYSGVPEMWIATYGMPVFFVLSGFLITKIILDNETRPWGSFLFRFYVRRGLRIFPVYYLVLVLAVIAGMLPYAMSQFFYVFNLKVFDVSLGPRVAEFVTHRNLIQAGTHLWSLSVEEQYYLLYPVLLLATPKARRRSMLFALLGMSIATRFVFATWLPRSYYGALLPVCGEYLLWGCLAADWDHKGTIKKLPAAWVLYGSLIAIAILWRFGNQTIIFGQFIPTHQQSLFAPAFAGLIVGLWHGGHTWPARLLAVPPLPYFGKMSYGMYLIHVFTWPMWDRIRLELPSAQVIPDFWATLVLTTILGMASWHFFESPINDLKDRVPYRKAPAKTQQTVPAGTLVAS